MSSSTFMGTVADLRVGDRYRWADGVTWYAAEQVGRIGNERRVEIEPNPDRIRRIPRREVELGQWMRLTSRGSQWRRCESQSGGNTYLVDVLSDKLAIGRCLRQEVKVGQWFRYPRSSWNLCSFAVGKDAILANREVEVLLTSEPEAVSHNHRFDLSLVDVHPAYPFVGRNTDIRRGDQWRPEGGDLWAFAHDDHAGPGRSQPLEVRPNPLRVAVVPRRDVKPGQRFRYVKRSKPDWRIAEQAHIPLTAAVEAIFNSEQEAADTMRCRQASDGLRCEKQRHNTGLHQHGQRVWGSVGDSDTVALQQDGLRAMKELRDRAEAAERAHKEACKREVMTQINSVSSTEHLRVRAQLDSAVAVQNQLRERITAAETAEQTAVTLTRRACEEVDGLLRELARVPRGGDALLLGRLEQFQQLRQDLAEAEADLNASHARERILEQQIKAERHLPWDGMTSSYSATRVIELLEQVRALEVKCDGIAAEALSKDEQLRALRDSRRWAGAGDIVLSMADLSVTETAELRAHLEGYLFARRHARRNGVL